MATSGIALQAVISKFNTDIVGIYSQDENGSPLEQIVTDANIMRASVNIQSRVFRHPLADGSTRVDHIIKLPVEIELALIVTNKRRLFGNLVSFNEPIPSNILRNIYGTFFEYYKNVRLLAVQTRASYYANMIVQAMPHQETVEVYNGIMLVIKLQETEFALPSVGVFSPADPTQSNTQERGELQAEAPTTNQQSAAAGVLDSIAGSLSGFFGGG